MSRFSTTCLSLPMTTDEVCHAYIDAQTALDKANMSLKHCRRLQKDLDLLQEITALKDVVAFWREQLLIKEKTA